MRTAYALATKMIFNQKKVNAGQLIQFGARNSAVAGVPARSFNRRYTAHIKVPAIY